MIHLGNLVVMMDFAQETNSKRQSTGWNLAGLLRFQGNALVLLLERTPSDVVLHQSGHSTLLLLIRIRLYLIQNRIRLARNIFKFLINSILTSISIP